VAVELSTATGERACVRCSSPLEAGDLRCAICGLPTPGVASGGPEAAIASVLRCHGCGAAVAYDAAVQAPKCGFCGSVMEVETPEDPIEESELHVRVRVDGEQAREALRAWLGSLGWFRPNDLQSQSAVDSLQALWWVGWVLDADVQATWAADSDAGARRSAWAPHAGEMSLALRNVVVPASRGLTEKECAALVPGYDIADAVREPDLERATLERFAVQRSAARRVIAQGLAATAAAHCRGEVPGSRVRNLNVAVLPKRLGTRRYAFPAYVLAYRYRGELYRAIVHGQDPSIVVGTAPYSWGKIAAVVLGGLALLGAIVLALAAAS
jgi:hypothetical protein